MWGVSLLFPHTNMQERPLELSDTEQLPTFPREGEGGGLKLYGITRSTLNWFISYLDKRIQTCKVNNVKSSRKLIKCGVPQGSNLGPLLLLLYVKDLSN